MKFTCNQSALSKALNTVSKAVSTRTTMPILKGILIEATAEGKLILTASDLEVSIRKEIDVDVEEAGSVVVIAKIFGDIIKKLPNDIISIYSEENNILIKTNYSESKLLGLDPSEFPKFGEREEDSQELSFDKELFRKMVHKTAFAASIDESKGILTGILTELSEDNISMVSLDGFRLALVNESVKNEIISKFVINAKSMSDISRIIVEDENEEADIKIYLGKKNTVFAIGNTKIILRLMEGEFIRYRDIIPADQTTKVIANKGLLLEGLERASLFAKEGKHNLIVMSLTNNLMTITSNSEEGEVLEEVIVEKTGNDIRIGFNSKYIIDVLKVIEEDELSLNFNTGISPCVIRPVDGKDFEYLVLPVRI